jgi:hypothetical protein
VERSALHATSKEGSRSSESIRNDQIQILIRSQKIILQESCSQTYQKKRRGGVIEVMDDSRVIPYNPFLLLKYGCHINIEYVFGQKACKYIFKYLLKGSNVLYQIPIKI